jgi:hypothetical protein
METDRPDAVYRLLRWFTLAVALAAVMLFCLITASIPSIEGILMEFDAAFPVFAVALFDIPQAVYWAFAACAVLALIGAQFLNLSAPSRVAVHTGIATALVVLTMLLFAAAFMPLIGLTTKVSNP